MMSFQPVLTGAAHTPNSPGKMQFPCFGLRDHAVEVAPWAAAEVGWRLCRDDCDGDGGLLRPIARHASPQMNLEIPISSRSQSAASTISGQLGAWLLRYVFSRGASLISSTGVILRREPESVRTLPGRCCALVGRSLSAWLAKPLDGWFSPEETRNELLLSEAITVSFRLGSWFVGVMWGQFSGSLGSLFTGERVIRYGPRPLRERLRGIAAYRSGAARASQRPSPSRPS